MLREIIKIKSEEYVLHIPKEYLNKEVEILVLPFNSNEINIQGNSKFPDIINKTNGILKNKNIDPVKWQKNIRSEWK